MTETSPAPTAACEPAWTDMHSDRSRRSSPVNTSASTSPAASPSPTTTKQSKLHTFDPDPRTDRAVVNAFKSALAVANLKSTAQLATVIPAFHHALREHLHHSETSARLCDVYHKLADAARNATDDPDMPRSPTGPRTAATDKALASMMARRLVLDGKGRKASASKVVKKPAKRRRGKPAGVWAAQNAHRRMDSDEQRSSNGPASRKQRYQELRAYFLRRSLEGKLSQDMEGM